MPTRKNNAAQSLISNLKRSLVPLAAITSALGIILAAVESITKVVAVAEVSFYVLTSLFFSVALIMFWPRKNGRLTKNAKKQRLIRQFACILVTLVYVFAIVATYYEHNIRVTKKAGPPVVNKPPMGESSSRFERLPKPPVSELVLEQFSLNEDLCSFQETDESLFALGGPTYRTFSANYAVSAAFEDGKGAGPRGDKPIEEVVPIIQKWLKTSGKSNLLPFVGNAGALSRIIRERGDIFNQIMFTPLELESLKQSSPSDYAIVMEWLLTCVGLQQPVLTLTIKNKGSESILLKDIIYKVEQVGNIKGGFSGSILAERTYDHSLKHEVGEQHWELKPPLQIAAKDRLSFNVRLFSETDEPGQCWFLKIETIASNGDSVTTEPFQIVMSK